MPPCRLALRSGPEPGPSELRQGGGERNDRRWHRSFLPDAAYVPRRRRQGQPSHQPAAQLLGDGDACGARSTAVIWAPRHASHGLVTPAPHANSSKRRPELGRTDESISRYSDQARVGYSSIASSTVRTRAIQEVALSDNPVGRRHPFDQLYHFAKQPRTRTALRRSAGAPPATGLRRRVQPTQLPLWARFQLCRSQEFELPVAWSPHTTPPSGLSHTPRATHRRSVPGLLGAPTRTRSVCAAPLDRFPWRHVTSGPSPTNSAASRDQVATRSVATDRIIACSGVRSTSISPYQPQ